MRAARHNRDNRRAAGGPATRGPAAGPGDRYKWVALSNTTAAMFMSVLNSIDTT
jgi:hypothetical protein